MKRKKVRESNSIKKVILFCGFVFLFVFVSLVLKFFFLIKSSEYDGQNRYTVQINSSDTTAKIISFDAKLRKSVTIFVSGSEALPVLDFALGVPIDARVKGNIIEGKSPAEDYYSLIYNLGINGYDMFRLMGASAGSENVAIKLHYPFDLQDFDKQTAELFTDSGIVEDQQTISIINASEVAGMGSRVERVLTKGGGNVISVTSAPTANKNTVLSYSGEKTYTVKKLEHMFKVLAKEKTSQGLADIDIILGADAGEL